MVDINTIKAATAGKYTEFSNSVSSALQDKLSNSAAYQNYNAEMDRINTSRDSFANISSSYAPEPAPAED